MDDAITAVGVPTALAAWAEARGLRGLAIHGSDVAVSVAMTLDGQHPPDPKSLRANLSRLAAMADEAALALGSPWPIVLLVDCPSDLPELRAELLRLADDPTWHKGKWCLYVVPLPVSTDDWAGPKTVAEVREALLNRSVLPATMPSLQTVGVAELLSVLSDAPQVPERLRAGVEDTAQGGDADALSGAVRRWVQAQVRPR